MIENIKDIKDKFDNFKPYINGYQNMKRASVLVPIIKNNDSHEILFEVRSKTLRSQPNEIAFPGGKIEENETLYIRFTKGKEEAEFELVKC